MTVESNYVIGLLRLVIDLKDLRQFFNQWEAKPKPIAPCTRDSSRALSELQIIARNCDWFIALFAPVVIGRSNCLGFGYLKTALNHSQCENSSFFLVAVIQWQLIFIIHWIAQSSLWTTRGWLRLFKGRIDPEMQAQFNITVTKCPVHLLVWFERMKRSARA